MFWCSYYEFKLINNLNLNLNLHIIPFIYYFVVNWVNWNVTNMILLDCNHEPSVLRCWNHEIIYWILNKISSDTVHTYPYYFFNHTLSIFLPVFYGQSNSKRLGRYFKRLFQFQLFNYFHCIGYDCQYILINVIQIFY